MCVYACLAICNKSGELYSGKKDVNLCVPGKPDLNVMNGCCRNNNQDLCVI